MPQGSTTLHEPAESLPPETQDLHRAIVSLMEELEAIDWYQQRVDATRDAELREILRHNRDEEQEHAAMVLEWIRRRSPSFDAKLRAYLFTNGSIVEREDALDSGTAAPAAKPVMTVGSLRGGR
jgi:ferritin-like protein